MELVYLLKAVCPHCGGKMSFDEAAANQVVHCPHCTAPTQLSLTKLMLRVTVKKPISIPDAPVAEAAEKTRLTPRWLRRRSQPAPAQ